MSITPRSTAGYNATHLNWSNVAGPISKRRPTRGGAVRRTGKRKRVGETLFCFRFSREKPGNFLLPPGRYGNGQNPLFQKAFLAPQHNTSRAHPCVKNIP